MSAFTLSKKVYWFGAILVLLGLINLGMILFKPHVYGLPILFLYSIPSNLAISLFPHEPVIVFYGRLYTPLIIALVAGIATCLAGFLDYQVFTPLLNLPKLDGLKQNGVYRTSIKYFSKTPFWVIAIAGFSPIPFAPIKVLSFSTNYSLPKYLGGLFVGRVPRYYLLAWIGVALNIPNWMLIVFFLLLFLYLGGAKAYNILKMRRLNPG